MNVFVMLVGTVLGVLIAGYMLGSVLRDIVRTIKHFFKR